MRDRELEHFRSIRDDPTWQGRRRRCRRCLAKTPGGIGTQSQALVALLILKHNFYIFK